jgi:glutamine synthetase
MRLSIATAGNDHRLGGNEAPPAIVSMFIGEELEAVVDSIINGREYAGAGRAKMNLGVPSVPTFTKDTTDRNRTSPFAFTGNKFEFRMPGSAQNIAMPNIVLNTAVAEELRQFADELEAAPDFDSAVTALIKRTLAEHSRILFGGNGYSSAWQAEAKKRGLLNLRTSVDAYAYLTAPKNIELFTSHGVMSESELRSREEILYENYSKIINIEALTMIEMARRDYIPAVGAYIAELADRASAKRAVIGDIGVRIESDLIRRLTELSEEAYDAVGRLEAEEASAAKIKDEHKRARAYASRVIPAMQLLREKVDAMEPLTATEYWPVPSYGDLMFGVQ